MMPLHTEYSGILEIKYLGINYYLQNITGYLNSSIFM